MAIKTRTSGILVEVNVLTPPVYAGPGDVVSGALAWWGLRAYSLAKVGTNAVRLRRDSDNAESDFVTLTGGALDVASITTFKGAANLFVVKLYDQTGNNLDQIQGTAGIQPGFSLNVLGSLPAMTGASVGGDLLDTPHTFAAQSQPITLSMVFKDTNSTDNFSGGFQNPGPRWGRTFNATTLRFYAGTDQDVTAAFNTWYRNNIVYNGVSSIVSLNGSQTAISPGTGGIALNDFAELFLTPGAVTTMDGFITEAGVWPVGFTAGQLTSMDSNQSVYWGV